MKIAHIEAVTLRFEYAAADRFTYAGGVCDARVTSLVLVHTDTGHVGIGSGYTHPGILHRVVERQLSPLLVGQDPREVEALWELMYGVTRWYGRKGAAMSALGALDTAFWDLRGKASGKPVRELLGGSSESCPAYASALLWKEPAALATDAARFVADGFRRVKMRCGRNWEYDTAAVAAVRDAVGPDHDVIVDGSMRYSLEDARRFANFLAEQGVFWYEEPFAPENLDDFMALRGTVDVRLAAGENEFGLQGFRELVRCKAVDILQPDTCRCGGVSEAWKVAQMAGRAGLGVATHTWNDAVTVVANAQVVSAAPTGITVEVDQTGNPFITDLLVEPLRIVDGELQLSRAPGLGIELDAAVVDRYRLEDPLTIPEGLYSDMVFGPGRLKPAGSDQNP
jgi:D-galactarolactone cycloisomerase